MHKELSYANNPKSLFRKHKKLVTWFANTKEGKEYLGLNFNNPIRLLLPNGYDRLTGKNKGEFIVSSRAIFVPKLYPALKVIDYFGSLAKFSEQKKMLLYEVGIIKLSSPFRPYDFRNLRYLTSTYSPDASPESTTVDGEVSRQGVNENWATIRAGAGNSFNDSRNVMWLEAFATGAGGTWDSLRRCIFLFDTSAFSATNTFVSAKVTLRTSTVYSSGGLANRLVPSTPASNTGLANSDYGQVGTTAYANDVSMTAGTTDYDFTLLTAGENALAIPQKAGAGITKHGLRFAKDIDNSEPTWGASADYGSDITSADSANAPLLTITYTIPATTSGGNFAFL